MIMKKVITGATAAGVLALSLFSALPAQADHLPPITSCSQVLVTPAQEGKDAVYKTVIEYQFVHVQDGNGNGNGQGPEPKWSTDPNWNAQGNPQSEGFTFSGLTREVLTDEILEAAVPAKDAVFKEECITQIPEHPVTPVDPVTPVEPAVPVLPEAPVAVVPDASVVPAELTPVPKSEAPATVHTAPHGEEELAYTGAEDYILPAGIALLTILAGVGLVRLNRRTA
jgi:hypothetical protein